MAYLLLSRRGDAAGLIGGSLRGVPLFARTRVSCCRALTILLFLAAVGPANAGPLDIFDIVGSWDTSSIFPNTISDPFVSNGDDQMVDELRWGLTEIDYLGQTYSAGGTGQSGYDFTPNGDYIPVPLDTTFLLGTFDHFNQPVFGTFLGSVDYSFSFSTNGSPNPLSSTFTFSHDETLNDGPCAAGPDGASVSMCDDFVGVVASPLNTALTVGSDTYLFELLGFSKDLGQTTFSTLQSPEMQKNSAGLYGRVTLQSVPEPATLGLFGVGLAVLGLRYRRGRP